MLKTNTVIVGAGIVGLAVAREISTSGHEVVVLEKHSRSGEETSSRNSGVIHSGIYYPENSIKAILCTEGNRLLYEYARRNNIGHKNTGKLIVASTQAEVNKLESLMERGKNNGIKGLELLSKAKLSKKQKEIKGELALYCPTSGIIDAAELISSLEADLQKKKVIVSFNSEVKKIEKNSSGFLIKVASSEDFYIQADNLINSAGLNAVELANKIDGLPKHVLPKAYFAKGHYFQLSGSHPFKNHLVYPLNKKDSLGVHVSIDISGKARFGPDISWVEEVNYQFDITLKNKFVKDIRTWWPNLYPDKLTPDYCGIRPKIYGPHEQPSDFVIQSDKDHTLNGLVNLFGIESPGLTCSLALAKKVSYLFK